MYINADAAGRCFDDPDVCAFREAIMASAPKRKTRRRVRRAPPAPAPTEAGLFDEPASPVRKPNPSIEEPTTPGMRAGEPEEACGLPDRAKIPASDLH